MFEKIIDINESYDSIFKKIYDATKIGLSKAIYPFADFFELSTCEFCNNFQYDYNSLFVTTLFNLLDHISIEFAEEIPIKNTIKNMPMFDPKLYDEYVMNKKRVERIKTSFNDRNPEHLEYLNVQNFKPKILATDALWYDLISEFPILKRFLFQKEPIVTKHFFEELDSVYAKINTYTGYDKFYLFYKLEMNGKLEMFYKCLSIIKKEKAKYKLSNDVIQKKIENLAKLHVITFNNRCFTELLKFYEKNDVDIEIFSEIILMPYEQKTINGVVFNIDKLIENFTKEPNVVSDIVLMLNYICFATFTHLSKKFIEEMNSTFDNDVQKFEYIQSIQHCTASIHLFNSYINENNHITLNKNCSNDITFAHFKKIYNIKKEPQRN